MQTRDAREPQAEAKGENEAAAKAEAEVVDGIAAAEIVTETTEEEAVGAPEAAPQAALELGAKAPEPEREAEAVARPAAEGEGEEPAKEDAPDVPPEPVAMTEVQRRCE